MLIFMIYKTREINLFFKIFSRCLLSLKDLLPFDKAVSTLCNYRSIDPLESFFSAKSLVLGEWQVPGV